MRRRHNQFCSRHRGYNPWITPFLDLQFQCFRLFGSCEYSRNSARARPKMPLNGKSRHLAACAPNDLRSGSSFCVDPRSNPEAVPKQQIRNGSSDDS